MDKTSVIEKIRRKYIDENLESAKKINYTDLTQADKLITVLYEDLPNTDIQGYPIASDYIAPNGTVYSVEDFDGLSDAEKKSCKLRFHYLPYSHELYIGTTGSGKTTGCVEPQLRAISSQRNKPNLFLTDPKGELFDRNAKHLQKQGYRIFVLNFKNLIRSDRWNPLLELYDTKMKIQNLGTNSKRYVGPVSSNLIRVGTAKDFTMSGYIECDGHAFPNEESFKNYIQFQHDFLEAHIDNLLNQLANMMIQVQSSTDKSWEYGAQELLKGIVQCMLEDAVDPNSGFTRDMMNFRTIQQYYLALKEPILAGHESLRNHWLLENKTNRPRTLMATALGNAPNTMRSYCGVFDGAVKDWFQGHIFALTTSNTIDLDDLDDKPFAIFLITRDYEKSDFLIAGLFIDWVYRKMLERAETTSNPRALHFLLDEFGNIPQIKDLENKISTSRSRNIWFHLVVQSYKQIDLVYGAERSVIIRDNCNSQIFLGAQNRNTKEIFSNECGKHFIPSLEATLNCRETSICEVPLVPVSNLDQINPGQMYIKRLYMPVIMSQFIRSYVCAQQGEFADFITGNGLSECTPTVIESFTAAKYTFSKLTSQPKNSSPFDDLY